MRALLQRVSHASVTVDGMVVGEIGHGLLILLGIGHGDGEVLVVSQFTLYADIRKGRRPSFTDAAPPALAEPLVERFKAAIASYGLKVEDGIFGAYMQVELLNDGPVTIWMDSEEL